VDKVIALLGGGEGQGISFNGQAEGPA
jgi:hypothetical protein